MNHKTSHLSSHAHDLCCHCLTRLQSLWRHSFTCFYVPCSHILVWNSSQILGLTFHANFQKWLTSQSYRFSQLNASIPSTSTGSQYLFFQGLKGDNIHMVWQYKILNEQVSSHWPPIQHLTLEKVYEVRAETLIPRPGPHPPLITAHKILVRLPVGKQHSCTHYWRWLAQNSILMQHQWQDGTHLLHTSTTQLRLLQANIVTLSIRLFKNGQSSSPAQFLKIFGSMFGLISSRSTTENTFYGTQPTRSLSLNTSFILANRQWSRAPGAGTKCTTSSREDILHCVWSCPLSQR